MGADEPEYLEPPVHGSLEATGAGAGGALGCALYLEAPRIISISNQVTNVYAFIAPVKGSIYSAPPDEAVFCEAW